jgi:hypothetical protein
LINDVFTASVAFKNTAKIFPLEIELSRAGDKMAWVEGQMLGEADEETKAPISVPQDFIPPGDFTDTPMSTQDDILTRPYQVRYAADVANMAFSHLESDILGRMKALSCYWQISKDLSEDELLGLCNECCVNHRVATEVLAIRLQLLQYVELEFLVNSS